MKKRILSMLLVIVMVLSLVPVSALAAPGLKITSSESMAYTLEEGETLTLTLTGAETGAEIEWTSENTSVATVAVNEEDNTQCTVTGVGEGKLNIVAKVSGVDVKYPLGVYAQVEDKPVIDGGSFSMTLAESTKTLTYTKPAGTFGTELTRWESSDPTVATIGLTDGTLTAKKAGTTDIRVFFNGQWSDAITCTIVNTFNGTISGNHTMVAGRTQELTLTFDTENPPTGINWYEISDDDNVVAIEKDPSDEYKCKVTASAVPAGSDSSTATVAAKWSEGGLEKNATFTLTINKVTKLSIKGDGVVSNELTLIGKQEVELTAEFPEGEKETDIEWTVSNLDNTITETHSGATMKVTGNKVGTATITAKIKGDPDTEATSVMVTVKGKSEITNKIDTLLMGDTHTCVLDTELLDESTFTWVSSNTAVATVDGKGVITPVAVGSTTITVKNGEEVLDSFTLEVKAEARIEIDSEMPGELLCGNSMDLKAVLKSADGSPAVDEAGNPVAVKWCLDNPTDSDYVMLENSKLTAKVGFIGRHEIKLIAYTGDVNAPDASESFTVTVVPKDEKIVLMKGEEDVTGTTIQLNLNDSTAVNNGITITAQLLPSTAGQDVIWQVNDSAGVCDYISNGKAEDGNPASITIAPAAAKKAGSVTVTATAGDGSGVKAQVTVQFAKLATELKIQNAPDQMRGGDTLTLSTSLDNDKTLSDRSVKWEISGEGAKYATISDKGVLDTSAVPELLSITVTATATANPAATDTKNITLCPSVKSITITMDDGSTVPGKFGFNDGPIQLMCDTNPEGAMGDFKWTSSNESVAVVGEDGRVTFVGAGNVRISCEATDGSKVKASVYLAVTKTAGNVEIEGVDELVSGKSAVMTATVWMDDMMEKAGNQNVIWSVVGTDRQPTTAASINSRGRLVAKTVNYGVDVIVIAYSAENKEIYDEHIVTIKPKKAVTFQAYLEGEDRILDSTLNLNIGEDACICGMWYIGADNDFKLEPDCTYFTSNSSVASFDEYGVLTGKKSGSATITVRATDPDTGNVYTAKFTVKVANLVGHVEIATPKANYLNSGSTMSLSATAWMDSSLSKKADNQSFTWKVYQEDEDTGDYVTATAASVSSSGKVTAKSVTKNTTVWVVAASKENSDYVDFVELTIRPKSNYTLRVFYNDEGTERTDTWNVSLGSLDLNNVLAKGYDATADSGAGRDVDPTVTWSTSNSNIIKVVGNKLTFGGKTGKVKITAKTVVGKTTYTASMYLNVVKPVTKIEVTKKTASQELYSGKTLLMAAKVTPSDATNKRVLWSFADPEDYNYASINATTGLIRANKGLTERQTITVVATTTDGSKVEDFMDITIYPLATKVTIELGGTAISTLEMDCKTSETLTAVLDPVGEANEDAVKWTSNRSSVVTVNQYGEIVAKRRGTATIKAAALDGSGKYATIKVTVQ